MLVKINFGVYSMNVMKKIRKVVINILLKLWMTNNLKQEKLVKKANKKKHTE